MKVVIQRVSSANVIISKEKVADIGLGLMILVGFEDADSETDIQWMTNKILNLRVFNDENGVMNRSVRDVDGQIIVVSQFTLHASTKKGHRPSYIKAAKPDVAIPLYEAFKKHLSKVFGKAIQSGEFGADMKVGLVNDGPVTIIIDSKNKS